VDRATLEFHSCLSPSHCYFELRSVADDQTTINVSCSLGKDTDYFNVGESALPLRVIEDADLTPFHSPSQSKDYLETTRLHEAMFVSSQDVELKRQAGYTRITDPFFCLRETIADLWKNVYKRPEVRYRSVAKSVFISWRSLYEHVHRVISLSVLLIKS